MNIQDIRDQWMREIRLKSKAELKADLERAGFIIVEDGTGPGIIDMNGKSIYFGVFEHHHELSPMIVSNTEVVYTDELGIAGFSVYPEIIQTASKFISSESDFGTFQIEYDFDELVEGGEIWTSLLNKKAS